MKPPIPLTAALPDAPLAPFAPVVTADDLAGYLQISLTEDGHISVRGTRLLVDWLLRRLAADGWHIELDSIHWCG